MTHGGFRGLGVLALAAVLLTGCTATPTSTGAGPSTSPSNTPPSSSPAPAPTVAPAATPGPRVQLKCADVYSLDAVKPLINATPTIEADESSPVHYFDDIANAQLGELGCVWIGPDGADAFAAEQLGIQIAPDATQLYAGHAAAALKPPAKGVSFTSTIGDSSGYWCLAYGSSMAACNAQMLVGSYWVSVRISAADTSNKTKIPVSTVSARTKSVLSHVAEQLTAAPKPVPQWVAAATTPPGFCDAGTSTAKVRSYFGIPGYTPTDSSQPTIDAGTAGTVGIKAICTWRDNGGKEGNLQVQLLAGGSWVYPGYHTTPYVDGYIRTFVPIQVTGAMNADLGCAQGFCESSFAVGTTFVQVDFDDRGAVKNRQALGKLATAIAAS